MRIGQLISSITIDHENNNHSFYKFQLSSSDNFIFVEFQDRAAVEGIEFTASTGRTFKLTVQYDLRLVVRLEFSSIDLISRTCKYKATLSIDEFELDPSMILFHYGMTATLEEFVEIKNYLRQGSILDEYLFRYQVEDFSDSVEVELESIY